MKSVNSLILVIASLCVASQGWASQLEPRTVFSPINGKPFQIVDIPVEALRRTDGPPDMGSDDDGCRHSSGINEYDHYVVTDPYTYFSAMSYEWGKNGRFSASLEPDFRQWVTSKDGFHTEWVIDKDKFYDRAQRTARVKGQQIKPIHEWVIPQAAVPVESKYDYALHSYRNRGATDAFLGKLALTGAWALRVKMNRPLLDVRLKAGIEEVNERLSRQMEETNSFDLAAVYAAYNKVINSSRLTDEAYFTAGITYVGLALRVGSLEEAVDTLDKMMSRFDSKDDDMHMFFRGLIRDRRNVISLDYMKFLGTAARHFTIALAAEQFPRAKIPEIVWAVAECHRRQGDASRAYDWFLALSDMKETDPRLRDEIRNMGRVPSADAPNNVLRGWLADEKLQTMTAEGLVHSGTISGPDTRVLNAIVVEGLGTLEYVHPTWQPRTNGNQNEVQGMIKEIGLAVLDYTQRAGDWPSSLGELWMRGVIPDRNGYNRFYCPVAGKPFLYQAIGGPLKNLPREMALVVSPDPIPTNQGPRYAVFTAGIKVEWLAKPIAPGELIPQE